MSSPVPAKSQPLHNFSLPLLKWQKSQTNNHQRGRRLAGSSPPPESAARRQSPTLDSAARRQSPLLDSAWRQSPMRDSASESESGCASEKRKISSSSDHAIDKSEKKSATAAEDVDGAGVAEAKSKIYIRLRTKNKADDVQNEVKTGNTTEGGEVEDFVGKSWNLRPRRPIRKLSNANGGGVSAVENKALQQMTPNRQEQGSLEAELGEKEMKQKFSIFLSRQEIEEDIFAMTGSKPARRPKKRAKNVQKQIDNVFPGLWLAAITPDSYKVSEAPAKG